VTVRYGGWRGETEPLHRVLSVPPERLLLLPCRFGFIVPIIPRVARVGRIGLGLFLLHPNVLLVLPSVAYLATTAKSMPGYPF
jgi:hypothetical protein